MSITKEEEKVFNKVLYEKYVSKYLENKPEYRLYSSAKGNAKRKNLEFSIQLSDINIPEMCPILNVPLVNKLNSGRQRYGISIHRLDPYKGYTPENIIVVSDLANRMLQDASEIELRAFLKFLSNKFL